MHQSRNTLAKNVRIEAAELASRRPPVRHCNNNEEYEHRDVSAKGAPATHLANFTKGLPHNLVTGLLLNSVDYKLFINGIQSGDPVDFEKTPLGPGLFDVNGDPTRTPDNPTEEAIASETFDRSEYWESEIAKSFVDKNKFDSREVGARVRAWESAGAGHVLDLEGPDSQSITMPPAPRLDSDELLAEIAEIYSMAILRDFPFGKFPLPDGSKISPGQKNADTTKPSRYAAKETEFHKAFNMLFDLPWFSGIAHEWGYRDQELTRRRDLTESNLFRGITSGEQVGPYLSQFLLLGNNALGGKDVMGNVDPDNRTPGDGFISYGAIGIQQKIRVATEGKDYMTTWEQFIDVQNGADLRGKESYELASRFDNGHRFMTTPRDLATYVHYDALYEAYLNACIFLLSSGAPFDRGIPFLESDTFDKQQGFAHFGGPHILTLVCEAATRALKAVRYQKFNNHRRVRPEAVAGLIDRWMYDESTSGSPLINGPFKPLERLMNGDGVDRDGFKQLKWAGKSFLNEIKDHNARNNSVFHEEEQPKDKNSYLLPMAFPEGSPMHPSYGAGHGTVAGACITILKAYFDHGWTPAAWMDGTQAVAYQPSCDGSRLVKLQLDKPLTLEGELNKLAANIAIGRNWAGVHYFSDYIESMRLGEKIAIGILEEQKLTYPENFTMTIPLFDGGAIRI